MSVSEPESGPGRERMRLPGVRAPKPLLSAESARQLTARQLELLEELEGIVGSEGVSDRTMAEIAARLGCSLRTLYGIAPSKEELVLTVVDRRLHHIGRKAIGSLDASLSPLDALRAYLHAANEAVQPTTVAFAKDFAAVSGAKRLLDGHEDYVIAVTQSLLDRAVAEGQIGPVDTAALAHVLGGLGREFARAETAALLHSKTPKESADAITEIVLRGLERA